MRFVLQAFAEWLNTLQYVATVTAVYCGMRGLSILQRVVYEGSWIQWCSVCGDDIAKLNSNFSNSIGASGYKVRRCGACQTTHRCADHPLVRSAEPSPYWQAY
jgi:hypothetical protein